jgi:hypothetical protein
MKNKIALMVAVGCIGASAASVNYDLLGRKGSKMNSPMVYKNVDYSKVKKNETQKIGSSLESGVLAKKSSGLENGAGYGVTAMEGAYFSRGWSNHNDDYYYLRAIAPSSSNPPSPWYGKNLFQYGSDKGFIGESNKYFINVSQSSASNFTYASNTNVASHGYGFGTYNYDFLDLVRPSPYINGQQITYTNFASLRELGAYSERPYISIWYGAQNNPAYGAAANPNTQYVWAVEWAQEWSRVGIYMPSFTPPAKMANNDVVSYVQTPSSSYNYAPGHEFDMSRAYKVIKNSSKLSDVYVGSSEYYQNDKVYMGLRVRKGQMGGSLKGKFYSNTARSLDNFIYDNRTVEIVAAGNSTDGLFNTEAHSVNAITVGAIDPASGNITSYTPNVTPKYCKEGIGACNNNTPSSGYRVGSAKPEVYNYSHFFFTDDNASYGTNADPNVKDRGRRYTKGNSTYTYDPYYDGTEASAAYTAGMVSDLLATNAFYRRHPEVVKAVLLTTSAASNKNVITYAKLLPGRSNPIYTYMHDSRFWVGNINDLKTHYNSVGAKEIRFSVKASDFPSHNFIAAISWLSSGDDINNLGKIPQDFDLYVYENDTDNVNNINRDHWTAKSSSGYNAFEKVEFTANSEYLTFRILLYSEEADSENYGQVVLGFDLMSH